VAYFKVLSQQVPGGTEETHENAGQNGPFPNLDLNPENSENDYEVLATGVNM
jgi:hypothetical protein